jgi:hypothetical protein
LDNDGVTHDAVFDGASLDIIDAFEYFVAV